MSIQRRRTIAIVFVLLLSLSVGVLLTYVHLLAEVRAEAQATLSAGAQRARNAVEGAERTPDPKTYLRRVVRDFDGDDRLTLIFRDANGETVDRSKPRPPTDVAPAWFLAMMATASPVAAVPLPQPLRSAGSMVLQEDPLGAIGEAWDDARLGLSIMAVLAGAMLVLVVMTVRRLPPPARIAEGAGVFEAQLSELRRHNLVLEERMMGARGAERAELARDLHDDVAPFLFGIEADATLVGHHLTTGTTGEALPRLQAITDSVHLMQHHLQHVLRRLSPETPDDRRLASQIDDLVAFWKRQAPGCDVSVHVAGGGLAPPLDRIAFRVVQESLSNALRHGAPTSIHVSIETGEERATLVIEDDGIGFADGDPNPGFGLTGMRDRVRSAGGTFAVGNRVGRRGAIVEVSLPLAASHDAAAACGTNAAA